MNAGDRNRTCAGTEPLPPQGSPFDRSGTPACNNFLTANLSLNVSIYELTAQVKGRATGLVIKDGY